MENKMKYITTPEIRQQLLAEVQEALSQTNPWVCDTLLALLDDFNTATGPKWCPECGTEHDFIECRGCNMTLENMNDAWNGEFEDYEGIEDYLPYLNKKR